jgi:hypothetical protein
VAWRTPYHVQANWIELSYDKCDYRLTSGAQEQAHPGGEVIESGQQKTSRSRTMLQILLIVVVVLVLLSFFGGYSGYVPSHFGYGGGGIGLIILIVLIVLLLR